MWICRDIPTWTIEQSHVAEVDPLDGLGRVSQRPEHEEISLPTANSSSFHETRFRIFASSRRKDHPNPEEWRKHTGNTRGIPPLTGFDPSRCAFELKNKFSLSLADFHEMTVAPKSRISTDSPVGRLAVTQELSSEMETCGVGMTGDTGMAVGFLARSILFLFF